jgi:hypothetical protein
MSQLPLRAQSRRRTSLFELSIVIFDREFKY